MGTLDKIRTSTVTPAELLGDPHPLAEALGSPAGLTSLRGVWGSGPRVADLASLRNFLGSYSARVLAPVELPAIHRAFLHASRYELRELLALDRALAVEPALQPFADASRAVGRSQLRRLRPLRDQRLVQRYLGAVDAGRAHGWHVVVYGVFLSLYSLPLRQGMLKYARQTVNGFIQSAAGPLHLAEAECAALAEEAGAGLPAAVEAALEQTPQARLQIC